MTRAPLLITEHTAGCLHLHPVRRPRWGSEALNLGWCPVVVNVCPRRPPGLDLLKSPLPSSHRQGARARAVGVSQVPEMMALRDVLTVPFDGNCHFSM